MTELVLRSGSTASGCRDVVVDPKCAGWTYSGLTIASLTKDETLELTTDDHEYLVWKWKPIDTPAETAGADR